MAMAARIAMIATTIISSIKVKPADRRWRDIGGFPLEVANMKHVLYRRQGADVFPVTVSWGPVERCYGARFQSNLLPVRSALVRIHQAGNPESSVGGICLVPAISCGLAWLARAVKAGLCLGLADC